MGRQPRRALSYLLDTHVLIQWQDETLLAAHAEIIDATRGREPLLVSDITLWEIALLYELGRITFDDLTLRKWLDEAVSLPLVGRQGISPEVAAETAALPSTFHRDPADRIIVATARILGATLLTRDQRIIDSGLVDVA